jgi:hypothetical protein
VAADSVSHPRTNIVAQVGREAAVSFILRQLRDYKPPKNPRLLALNSQARRLEDQLGVRHWSHHVRAHNKMANALANLAMDCRTSSQVQHPSAHSGTVTDDLELRPLEMARRAQASDEAAILRLVVGGGAVSMAHGRAPNDRRLA